MGKKSPKHRKDHESAHAKRSQDISEEVEDHGKKIKFYNIGIIMIWIFTLAGTLSFKYWQWLPTYGMFLWWQLILWALVGFAAMYLYWRREEDKGYTTPMILAILYVVVTIPIVLLSEP
jgi:fatty acid desaturase